MSLTVTLHAWWLGAYLVVGAVLLLPCEYAAYLQTQRSDRAGFWSSWWRVVRRRPIRILVPIVAWPFGLWELWGVRP